MSAGLTDVTTTVDGAACHVRYVGSGTSCLYLHSEFGESADHVAVRHLADAGYRVAVPVIPGFEPGTEPEWDELSHTVFWLNCLCDALDFDGPMTVVGSGFGGWMAAELAVWFPERVQKLALIGAMGLRLDGSAVGELFREGLGPLSPMVLPYGGSLEELIPPPGPPEGRRLHLLRALEATARVAWAPYFYDSKLLERLARVSCPTTILWGDDDRVVPISHGQEYASRIHGATFSVVARTGHLPLLERPETVVPLIVGGADS